MQRPCESVVRCDGSSRPPPRGEAVRLPPMDTALAIDIGGTKLAAGIVNGDGVLLHRDEAPTPATADPDVLFAALLRLVEALPPAAHVVCGAGCGGPMTRGGGGGSPLNIPAGRPFLLRRRLHQGDRVPVFVDTAVHAHHPRAGRAV